MQAAFKGPEISIHALLAESDPCAWYAPAGAHISIHALLAESDTDRMFCSRQRLNFYPRSPCGERPSAAAPIKLTRSISIHALLAESDFNSFSLNINGPLFLSTLSLRRATFCPTLEGHKRPISIHALLAESDRRSVKLFHQNYISIHALLAESDSPNPVCIMITIVISIHALLAESDSVLVCSVGFER